MPFGNGKLEWSDVGGFFNYLGDKTFGTISRGFAPIRNSLGIYGSDDANPEGSNSSSSYPFDGLSITDQFGDTIRDLQQQAAERQEAFQTNSAEKAMQFSADEAQKARDWSEYMSSTQYSRAVQDLKSAGLNPVLAAGGGISSGSFSSSTSATGIAQSGSQAQVSEYNSGLSALEVYLETAASVINSVSNVFKIDATSLVGGLNGKSNKIGFG